MLAPLSDRDRRDQTSSGPFLLLLPPPSKSRPFLLSKTLDQMRAYAPYVNYRRGKRWAHRPGHLRVGMDVSPRAPYNYRQSIVKYSSSQGRTINEWRDKVTRMIGRCSPRHCSYVPSLWYRPSGRYFSYSDAVYLAIPLAKERKAHHQCGVVCLGCLTMHFEDKSCITNRVHSAG